MTAVMSFGMFVFSVSTTLYDQLQRRRSFAIARNQRIGARDATQFTGPGDETISLSGTAYSEMGDIEASMQEMANIGNEGNALPLVCANGTVYGTFIMTGLDEQQKMFWPDGSPRAINFNLDLLRVDDTVSSNGVSASSGMTATTGQWV